MSYQETLDYLYGLEHFGISLGLENIRALCAAAGNPQDRLAIIHVAGSNGKGSTIAFLCSLCRAGGLSVGVYTSPHLRHFSERITIDGAPITEAEIAALAAQLRPVAEAIPRVVTFFDFTTAMALIYFARRRPDIVLMETGLGGRLDATNVVSQPLLTVITNISLEHEEYLGRTLLAVAREKAGILKAGVPLISGVRLPGVRQYLAERCRELGGTAEFLGRDFRIRRAGEDGFNYAGAGRLGNIVLGLKGRHQADNAALALRSAELLAARGLMNIDADAARRALAATRWPGRLQQVAKNPDFYLDGAHNPDGIRALAAALPRLKAGHRRLVLILGVMKDKRIPVMCKRIAPLADEIIVTRARLDRACAVDRLAAEFHRLAERVMLSASVGEAIDKAFERATAEDLVLLTGSLYCVGEALEHPRLAAYLGPEQEER